MVRSDYNIINNKFTFSNQGWKYQYWRKYQGSRFTEISTDIFNIDIDIGKNEKNNRYLHKTLKIASEIIGNKKELNNI